MPNGLQQFVFIAVPQTTDQRHLDYLNQERDEIMKHVHHARDSDGMGAAIARSQSVTHESITELLREDVDKERLTIFHYAGHANGTQLFFKDGAASASGVAELLASLPNLKLVFLNGCETLDQVNHLLENGIKAVLATSKPVDDDVAQRLSASFYKNLASGKTLEEAFHEAQQDTLSFSNTLRKHVGKRFSTPIPGTDQTSNVFDWGLYTQEDADLDWRLTQRLPDPVGELLEALKMFPHFDTHKEVFNTFFLEKGHKSPRCAFAIHGKKNHGQSWLMHEGLLYRSQLKQHDKLASIDYDRRGDNTIMLLLRDIVQRLEFPDDRVKRAWKLQSNPERLQDADYISLINDIAIATNERIKTQATVIHIYNAASAIVDLLDEIVEGFWNPFSKKLQELKAETQLKACILIIAEEDFELTENSSPLCVPIDPDFPDFQTQNLFLLPNIDAVEIRTMLRWMGACDKLQSYEALYEYRSVGAFKALFESYRVIDKEESDKKDKRVKPTPIDAMRVICEELGYTLSLQNSDKRWKLDAIK